MTTLIRANLKFLSPLQFLILMLLFCSGCGTTHAQTNKYAVLLQQAEIAGRKDIVKLNDKLTQFADDLTHFSTDEKCYYDYLKLYASAYKGKYQSSIDNLQQYLGQCQDLNSQLRGHKHLANLQVISGNYEESIVNLNTAIDLSAQVDDSYLVVQVYAVASIVYRLIHQDELSLKYAELLIQSDYSDDWVCYGGNNKFRILLRQNKIVDDTEINKFIAVCEKAELSLLKLFIQLDWYRYVVIKNDDQLLIQKGLNDLLQLKAEITATQFKNIQVYYQAVLAQFYMKTGQYSQAEKTAKAAINDNDSIGNSEQLLLALQVLIELNVEENTEVDAYRYLAQKAAVEKRMYEARLAKQVAFFRIKHNTLAQEQKIEQLNKNNQLLELKNRLASETSQKQQLLMLLVLTGLVLLGFWTYKIKRRHDYFKSVSEVDHLTKVFTRKAFEEQLVPILESSEIKSIPVNIAILDLDHFKVVNDKFGHMVGDWVLQNIIIACEQVIDQDTLIARLGGEEFCIVTPGISLTASIELLEKMRKAIENLDCSPSGQKFNVTASFGVTCTEVSGYKKTKLMSHADLALFEAKHKGRNMVVAYQIN